MRPLAAGGITLLLGAVGIAGLLIQSFGQASPSYAANLVSFDNGASRFAAAKSVEASQNQSASRFAKQAVGAMPLDQFSVAVSSSGKSADDQLRILNLAAALGWRDPATNIALIESGLRENRPDIAAQRIDATGRLLGAAPVTAYADRLLTKPRGIAELTKRAKARNDGAWWQGYFRTAPETREIAEARARLISGFDKGDGAWLRRTIRDASIGFSRANAEDLSITLARDLSADRRAQSSAIYDGDFALFDPAVEGLIGEWQIPAEAPAIIETMSAGGVLLQQTARNGGPVFIQKLVLTPGKWILSASGTAAQTGSFRWSIGCRGQGEAEMVPADFGKQEGAIGDWTFTVAEPCSSASVTLSALQRDTGNPAVAELRNVALVQE